MKIVNASGSLTIQADTAVTGQGQDSRQLTLGPGFSNTGQRMYEETVTQAPQIATQGNPGDAFEDLSATDGLSEINLLMVRCSQQTVLRLNALPAVTQAVAGAFPTGFGGGESVTVTIDGVAVVTSFLIADQSALQCAARMNAAAALAGLATPRFTVVNGQLRVEGVATAVGSGGIGQIAVTAGAPATTLGLAAAASPTVQNAQGQDVTVDGLFLSEFPTTGSRKLTKVQVSGTATLDVVAAGRA